MKQMDNHIPYRFTPIPTHLFMCLDNNCRSVLFALIQLSSFFADDNGWFFRSNADLEAETNLSPKVIIGALHALFIEGIIEVIPQQKGRGIKQESRKYKVNFGKFLEYEKISLDDCMKNSDYMIETSDYKHGPLTFQRTSPPSSVQTSVQTSTPTSAQSTNNIDSRENIENKETIYNNDNIIVKPNGNSIPDGDCSLSSSVEGSNVNPTDNTAIDGSCSFSDAIPTCSSEPDGNRTTSYTLPTCSLSSSNPVSSTTYSPKGESSNPEGLKQLSIPREKEISSQQPSDSNASEGTVSVSVPCQFEDGDSCAQTGIQEDEIQLIQALDILYRYGKYHLQFDAVSKQARNDATSLAMKCYGWDFNTAKAWVQEQCKENLKNTKQDDSNPSIPAPAPEDNEAHRQELIDSLYSKLKIVVDYDLNQTPEDGRDKDALNDAIHLLMSINDCGYDEARDDIQAYRKKERRKAEEARIDAEVAKAAAILNDDPKPKPDYGEYSKMFIDDDALMSDDDFDHAW